MTVLIVTNTFDEARNILRKNRDNQKLTRCVIYPVPVFETRRDTVYIVPATIFDEATCGLRVDILINLSDRDIVRIEDGAVFQREEKYDR